MKNLHRRRFLKLMGAGGAMTLLGNCQSQTGNGDVAGFPNHPNVILVMTDDQGYADLGCHGNPVVRTPQIDRLYEESTRFGHFYVSPTCAATRGALLTGRHEFRGGITHTMLGRSLLSEHEITLSEILQTAGYRTGLFGKWHLGDNYPFRPMDRGFQECLYHGAGGLTQTPDYWGNTYFNPTLNHNGIWEQTEGFCTDIFFEAALNWIEADRAAPFFAYIATNAPHAPFTVAEEYAGPYREMGLDEETVGFYGMITNIDDNMGRLIERLRLTGLEENTLVIFMTDNGSALACRNNLYNAGMRGCKKSAHEGGVRVPCFFRMPGVISVGMEVDQIAAHVDMLPTLAELCGAELPGDRRLDGRSLLPLLSGNSADWQKRFLITHGARWPVNEEPPKYENCSVRSQRFRWVDNKELYDMKTDPGETVNVIGQFTNEAAEMKRIYDDWWKEISPGFLKPQRIKLGASVENPSFLTCMDWGESLLVPGEPDWRIIPLWQQGCLEALAKGEPFLTPPQYGSKPIPQGVMGAWRVEFMQSGAYAFTLRKLPPQAPSEWRSLENGTAHLRCGTVNVDVEIDGGMRSVKFDVSVERGAAELECWFTGQRKDGKTSGAYFVEVRYLG